MPTISKRSKRSSPAKPRPSRPRLDRPFSDALWNEAAGTAAQYRLILEPTSEGFLGRAIEFPTVFERGRSADECVASLRRALCVAVASMLEMGQKPPAPSAAGVRSRQVNIRLSSDEQLFLEDAARRAGFRGLSDYLRSVALARAERSQ